VATGIPVTEPLSCYRRVAESLGRSRAKNQTERKVPRIMKNQRSKRGFLQQIIKEGNHMLQRAPSPRFRKILDIAPLKKEMLLTECMMTARSLKCRKRPQRRRKIRTVGWKGTLMNQ